MLEKSRNFAHAPEVAKITSDMGLKSGCGKNGSTSATYTLSTVLRLELRFTYMYENRYTHVNTPIPTKKSLGAKSQTQRKLVIFN